MTSRCAICGQVERLSLAGYCQYCYHTKNADALERIAAIPSMIRQELIAKGVLLESEDLPGEPTDKQKNSRDDTDMIISETQGYLSSS